MHKECDLIPKRSGQYFINFLNKKNSKNRTKGYLYCTDDQRMKLGDTTADQQYKMIVGNIIRNWLITLESKDNSWKKSSYEDDINAGNLLKYLSKNINDITFHKNSSQSPYDVYSVDGLVAVELKSKKGKDDQFLGNATVYPDIIPANRVIPEKSAKKALSDTEYDSIDQIPDMAVIVVYVKYSRKTRRVVDWQIDGRGALGGGDIKISREEAISCHDMFPYMNNPEILKRYLEDIARQMEADGKDSIFPRRIVENYHKNYVNFKVRKLIDVKGPFDE